MENALIIFVSTAVGGFVGYRLRSVLTHRDSDKTQDTNIPRWTEKQGAMDFHVEGIHVDLHRGVVFPANEEVIDVASLISSNTETLKRTREARRANRKVFAGRGLS